MKDLRGLVTSPRAWVYAALAGTLLLGGIDLEMTWDLVLPAFKPYRLIGVIAASVALASLLCVWVRRQLEEPGARRRFVLPFAVGFALLPLAGVGAQRTPPSVEAYQALGDFILRWLAFIAAVAIGITLCTWVLALVYYVRLAERTEATDGPQLVSAAIAGGLLGFSTGFSLLHRLLMGFAWRRPDFVRQTTVWGIWGTVWVGAAIWLVLVVRARARQRRWLERVREGRDSDYEIVPLSEHPEWAKLPPYLTARSYSGVLVCEPQDESEERELLGRVE